MIGAMAFSDVQTLRYARHLNLAEVGPTGQEKLLKARVLVVGAGGLGSPVILYLAAAGVGTIGVVDDDDVDLSNLQRQVLHTTSRVGVAKADSAKAAVAALNPDVNLVAHRQRLNFDNARALIDGYDIVADGSDNFDTRFLINDACFFAGKTLVSAAVLRFDGQLSTYTPHRGGPCYRCVFGEAPPDNVWTCSQVGILGAVAGVMGTLQATEILKEILGIGEGMSGRLLIHDALSATSRIVKIKRDAGCALCGDRPTIRDLSIHAAGNGGVCSV